MNKYIKLLVESIFDDNADIFNDDTAAIDVATDIYNNFFGRVLDIVPSTLGAANPYLTNPTIDEDEGITYIKKDETNQDKTCEVYYVYPLTNYKLMKLGPRKRKKYPIGFFYLYKLVIYFNRTVDLYMLKSNITDKLTLNANIMQFIDQSPYKINALKFYHYKEYVDRFEETLTNSNNISKVWIFFPDSKSRTEKIVSDNLVNNFPEIIYPTMSEKFLDNNPNGFTTPIYKSWFSSNDMFLKFVKKLVGNNINIVDEHFYVYNKNTFNDLEQKITSGEQKKEIELENNKSYQFILKELGQEYIDKFEKLITYLLSQPGYKNIYLKSFNTLRKVKICMNDTIVNLIKENNLCEIGQDNDKDYYLLKYCLYKMFYNIHAYNLQSYNDKTSLGDILEGKWTDFGIRAYDINDLPIKYNDVSSLYTLYYIIGISINQLNGLLDYVQTSGDGEQKSVENYMKNISYINNLNFEYLNNQLKFIIDEKIKKFKLK